MTLPVAEDLVSTKHSPGTTFPHTHHNHNNTLNSFNYSHNHSHNYNHLPGFHHPPQTMSQRSDITTTTEGALPRTATAQQETKAMESMQHFFILFITASV